MNNAAQLIEYAKGYQMLEMHEDALAELAKLPRATAELAEILNWRTALLIQLKSWDEALRTASLCLELHPNEASAFLHRSFVLHELGRTEDAMSGLSEGPAYLAAIPLYHYNLACYACRLGFLEDARTHLNRAIAIDPRLRELAARDSDLEALWPELG